MSKTLREMFDELIMAVPFTSAEARYIPKIKIALEKQIPKKPYKDNDNGIYETEHCPTCHRRLFPNDHHCRCGQALDWSDTE